MSQGSKKMLSWLIAIVIGIGMLIIIDWIIPGSRIGTLFHIGLSALWGLLAIFILIILLFVFGIGYAIKKGQGMWEFSRLKEVYGRLIRNKFVEKVDRVAGHTGVLNKVWHKRRILPDKLPEIMKENIVYLFALNNYLKRYYIWWVKYSQVTNAEHICFEVEKWNEKYMFYFEEYNNLLTDIHKCRDGNSVIDPTKNVEIEVGLFPAIREYCTVLNEFFSLITEVIGAHINASKAAKTITKKELEDFGNRLANIDASLGLKMGKMETSKKMLNDRIKAYGDFTLVRTQLLLVLDQCNPYGNQEHQYRLISKGTPLVDQWGRIHPAATKSLEVNMYGEVLEDINRNGYKNENKLFKQDSVEDVIRRVDPTYLRECLKKGSNPIKWLKEPHHIPEHMTNDWDGAFRNMRFGKYRKYSKSFRDYLAVMDKVGRVQFEDESQISFTPGFKEEGSAAFDRRAKVNPGLMAYAGRLHIHDNFEDVMKNPYEDPYPGVSSIGMTVYLESLFEYDTENVKALDNYLQRFIKDAQKTVTSKHDVVETFVPFSQKEKSH